VLFLCTHNSARSILAEALLNHLGRGRFKAYSAGSQPRGEPNPLALQVLADAGIATEGLTSKSWDVFGAVDAPPMDLVITVCDNAAGEACPYWPGQPATAHWGYPDPSSTEGPHADRVAAFYRTMLAIRHRLELLTNLPPAALDRLALERSARDLARS
jgi:protein-tyrosine-phosphatase